MRSWPYVVLGGIVIWGVSILASLWMQSQGMNWAMRELALLPACLVSGYELGKWHRRRRSAS